MPTPSPRPLWLDRIENHSGGADSGLTEAIDEAALLHFLVTGGLLKGCWLLEEGAAVENLTGDGEKHPTPSPREDKMEVQVRGFCENWDKRIRKPSGWMYPGPLA